MISKRETLRKLADRLLELIDLYGETSDQVEQFMWRHINNKPFIESAITTIDIRTGKLLEDINSNPELPY